MAEPFSLAASALQVAGAGVSLAKTLHDYIAAVKGAQRHVKAVVVEVRLTASVLEHLGALLKENEAEKLCTADVISDADDALQGCRDAFGEIEEAFGSGLRALPDGTRIVSTTARFAWPFKKGKVEALQANLERLKSTLLLMLSVLSYAREKAFRPADAFPVQRLQIQNLIKTKDDATKRYEELIVDLQKLQTDDDRSRLLTTTSDGTPLPHIAMSAVGLPSSTTTPANTDSTALLKQLSVCASTVSGLAASISMAMATYHPDRPLSAFGIRDSYMEVKNALQDLLAPLNAVDRTTTDASSHTASHHMTSGAQSFTKEEPVGSVHSLQTRERSAGHSAVDEYEQQLRLLELQNKKRPLMARQEQNALAAFFPPFRIPPTAGSGPEMARSAGGMLLSDAFKPPAAKKRKVSYSQLSSSSHDQTATQVPRPVTPANRAPFDQRATTFTQKSGVAVPQVSEPIDEESIMAELSPAHSQQEHDQQIGSNEPEGSLLAPESPGLDLDFSYSEDPNALEEFDFDSPLNRDGKGEAEFAALFDSGNASPPRCDGDDEDEGEDNGLEVDESDGVDVLVKRWTTIDV